MERARQCGPGRGPQPDGPRPAFDRGRRAAQLREGWDDDLGRSPRGSAFLLSPRWSASRLSPRGSAPGTFCGQRARVAVRGREGRARCPQRCPVALASVSLVVHTTRFRNHTWADPAVVADSAASARQGPRHPGSPAHHPPRTYMASAVPRHARAAPGRTKRVPGWARLQYGAGHDAPLETGHGEDRDAPADRCDGCMRR
jgi:hypothetical protein